MSGEFMVYGLRKRHKVKSSNYSIDVADLRNRRSKPTCIRRGLGLKIMGRAPVRGVFRSLEHCHMSLCWGVLYKYGAPNETHRKALILV